MRQSAARGFLGRSRAVARSTAYDREMAEPVGPWPEADVEALKAMSAEELIGRASNWTQQDKYAMELQRRALAEQAELTDALRDLRRSTDTSSTRILWATWILVALTVVIAMLTLVLVVNPPD